MSILILYTFIFETERKNDTEREITHLDLFPKCLQYPKLGQGQESRIFCYNSSSWLSETQALEPSLAFPQDVRLAECQNWEWNQTQTETLSLGIPSSVLNSASQAHHKLHIHFGYSRKGLHSKTYTIMIMWVAKNGRKLLQEAWKLENLFKKNSCLSNVNLVAF